MNLPFFYIQNLSAASITLDEPTSKHIAGVLRMQRGEGLLLTDGKGTKAAAIITDDNRKRCTVSIKSVEHDVPASPNITIAISNLKNASRFEWFLEKATEIGITEIVPLLCRRTEKAAFRHDRMNSILVSAMLQSQQSWLPVLHPPTAISEVIKSATQQQKFIAHCLPEKKAALQASLLMADYSSLILIGPEGDFTEAEIGLALQNNFTPVALGNTRLRTETAGMVAATLLRLSGGS